MKIYVITAGEYSCYQIYGATTDPVRAEDMRKKVSMWAHEEADIEEFENGVFENDKIDNLIPQRYFRVMFTDQDPKVKEFIDYPNKRITVKEEKRSAGWSINENGFPIREIYTVFTVDHIKADDEKHAIKIAIDAIAEYRAKSEGIS